MILQQFKRGIFLPVYDGQEASDVYPCPLETQQFSLYNRFWKAAALNTLLEAKRRNNEEMDKQGAVLQRSFSYGMRGQEALHAHQFPVPKAYNEEKFSGK